MWKARDVRVTMVLGVGSAQYSTQLRLMLYCYLDSTSRTIIVHVHACIISLPYILIHDIVELSNFHVQVLVHVYTCFYVRDEKEERKKQARSNKQTRQHVRTCLSFIQCSYEDNYFSLFRLCCDADTKVEDFWA